MPRVRTRKDMYLIKISIKNQFVRDGYFVIPRARDVFLMFPPQESRIKSVSKPLALKFGFAMLYEKRELMQHAKKYGFLLHNVRELRGAYRVKDFFTSAFLTGTEVPAMCADLENRSVELEKELKEKKLKEYVVKQHVVKYGKRA